MTKLDAFFETCPGPSPKASQTNTFVRLGSKSGSRCCLLEHQNPHKYLKCGLWSPFGFPLTRRSSPDLKKVPKSMISGWFWLLCLGFSFCIVCSDLYIVPFGMVMLFFAGLCLSSPGSSRGYHRLSQIDASERLPSVYVRCVAQARAGFCIARLAILHSLCSQQLVMATDGNVVSFAG